MPSSLSNISTFANKAFLPQSATFFCYLYTFINRYIKFFLFGVLFLAGLENLLKTELGPYYLFMKSSLIKPSGLLSAESKLSSSAFLRITCLL